MKVGIIADVHIANHRRWGGPLVGGLNARGRECIDVLRRAIASMDQAGCRAIFILGDLFDSSRPSPPLVAATIEAMRADAAVYVLLGNHDMQSPERLDHAAASMMFTSGITVVTSTTTVRYGELTVVMIPYQAGAAAEWLPGEMAEGCEGVSGHKLVLTHIGIWDDSTPSFLKSARDAVGLGQVRFLCDVHRVSGFAAGNWHQPKHWPPTPHERVEVLIPGTICPHSFSDAQPVAFPPIGSTWTYSLRDGAFMPGVTIPGPRFETVGLDYFMRELVPTAPEWNFYTRLRVPRAQLADAIKARDAFTHGPVDIDVIDEDNPIAEVAASAIKAADGDLVEAYSDLADVKDPGTREGVQRRLAEYRKASS